MVVFMIILQLLFLIGIVFVCILMRSYLPSYTKEKAKNLATKEDISDITRKVEEVRSFHSAELEHLKVELGILAKKHDILLDERIRVFKDLQKSLVAFKRYCEAALGEFAASEFHPTLDSLPEGIEKSTLTHLTSLHYLEQDNFIFLSDRARAVLGDLHDQMSLMCSMELAMFDNPGRKEFMQGVPAAYRSAMKNVDECLTELYKDLQMP